MQPAGPLRRRPVRGPDGEVAAATAARRTAGPIHGSALVRDEWSSLRGSVATGLVADGMDATRQRLAPPARHRRPSQRRHAPCPQGCSPSARTGRTAHRLARSATAPGSNSRKLTVALPGSGNIDATGTTTRLDLALSGEGTALLRELIARDANAALSGDGSIMLTATHSLTARISGNGTVLYSGNPPHVTQRITGSGTISPQEVRRPAVDCQRRGSPASPFHGNATVPTRPSAHSTWDTGGRLLVETWPRRFPRSDRRRNSPTRSRIRRAPASRPSCRWRRWRLPRASSCRRPARRPTLPFER